MAAVVFRSICSDAPAEPAQLTVQDGRRGGQEWELSLPAGPGAEGAALAGREAARVLTGLAWAEWRLMADSLAEATGLSPSEALAAWGEGFWEEYRLDAVVYLVLASGDGPRATAAEASLAWEARFGHVHIDDARDVEALEEARRLAREARRRTFPLSIFFSLAGRAGVDVPKQQ